MICYLCVGSGPCRRCGGTGVEPDTARMRAAETSAVEAWVADFDLWTFEPTVRPEGVTE